MMTSLQALTSRLRHHIVSNAISTNNVYWEHGSDPKQEKILVFQA